MPPWTAPRRLGATAVLYAVFVGGWHLGRLLPHVGCHTPEPATASEPLTIGEPGDVHRDFSRVVSHATDTLTVQIFPTDVIVSCDGTPRPRLLAWVTGDWR